MFYTGNNVRFCFPWYAQRVRSAIFCSRADFPASFFRRNPNSRGHAVFCPSTVYPSSPWKLRNCFVERERSRFFGGWRDKKWNIGVLIVGGSFRLRLLCLFLSFPCSFNQRKLHLPRFYFSACPFMSWKLLWDGFPSNPVFRYFLASLHRERPPDTAPRLAVKRKFPSAEFLS